MSKDIEFRFAPVVLEGNSLKGVVMRYGEVSEGAPRPERFLPGAFIYDDVILNVQHDRARPIARTGGGGLILADTDEALTLAAELPETREAADALALVRSKVLRGLSVEFRAVREKIDPGGVRVIESAILSGVGLVDKPAYKASHVEARRIGGIRFSFRVPYRRPLRCQCCPKADIVDFETEAFTESLASKEVLVIAGDYKGALASKERGTLRTRQTKQGLEVETDIADTQAGKDVVAQAVDVPLYARPVVDFERSEYEVIDGIAKVKNAYLRAFLIGPTDATDGWDPLQVIRENENRRDNKWLWI